MPATTKIAVGQSSSADLKPVLHRVSVNCLGKRGCFVGPRPTDPSSDADDDPGVKDKTLDNQTSSPLAFADHPSIEPCIPSILILFYRLVSLSSLCVDHNFAMMAVERLGSILKHLSPGGLSTM
jgi:hypothetical protein